MMSQPGFGSVTSLSTPRVNHGGNTQPSHHASKKKVEALPFVLASTLRPSSPCPPLPPPPCPHTCSYIPPTTQTHTHPEPPRQWQTGGGGRWEAYKRVRDFRGRAEETSHRQPHHRQQHLLHFPRLRALRPVRGASLTCTLLTYNAARGSCGSSSAPSSPHSCHSSMQLLVVLAALMGVVFSVRAAAVLPLDDRSPVHISRVSVMPFLLFCSSYLRNWIKC